MPELYIGLLSGTSMDGIDAALFDSGDNWKLIAKHAHHIPSRISDVLWELIKNDNIHDLRVKTMDQELGILFAAAVQDLLIIAGKHAQDIIAIGSHGQNISHHPNDPKPYTLQIGDPQIIANRTSITTVGQFRIADVAAGGQGAPLSPLFHKHFLQDPVRPRAIVNIGGIANVSFVAPREDVTGFDTGPGNGLLDAWIKKHKDKSYDENGAWAATGTVNQALLTQLLADPYFQKSPPKSTGKEYFNLAWLEKILHEASVKEITAVDVQTTLIELTARSIVDAVHKKWPCCDIYLCGGGVQNTFLYDRIKTLAHGMRVLTTTDLGYDADYLEAMLFAWLAKLRLENQLIDTTKITSAKHPVYLGEIYQPQNAISV